MRLREKQRSQPVNDKEPPTKRPKFSVKSRAEPEEMDVPTHREEIAKEWGKNKPNIDHLKQLLKYTKQDRLKILSENPSGSLCPVFEMYPCFRESTFVSIISYGMLNVELIL